MTAPLRAGMVFVPTPVSRIRVGDHVYDDLAGVRCVKAVRDEVERFYLTYHEGGFGSWHHVGETVARGVFH